VFHLVSQQPAKPIFSAEISTTEEPEYCMVANPRWKGKGTLLAKEAASAETAKAEVKLVKVPKEIVDSQHSQEAEARNCQDCGKLGPLAKQCKVRQFKNAQRKLYGPDTTFCMVNSVRATTVANISSGDCEEDVMGAHDFTGYRRDKEMSEPHLTMSISDSDRLSSRSRQETLEVFAHMAGLGTMSALLGTLTVGLVVGAHKTRPLELLGIGGTCSVMEVGSLAGTDMDVWIFP
jgi:hypothetical protein